MNEPQEGAPGKPGRLRLLTVPRQDQGISGPFRSSPRLLGRVPDLPLVEHLDGVVVERPPVGEEEVHPVSACHIATSTDHQPLRPQWGQAARTVRDHALGVQDQIQLPQ